MFARWDLNYNFNVRNGFNDINSLVEGFIFTISTVLQENSQPKLISYQP
jgi:hypothetical protein